MGTPIDFVIYYGNSFDNVSSYSADDIIIKIVDGDFISTIYENDSLNCFKLEDDGEESDFPEEHMALYEELKDSSETYLLIGKTVVDKSYEMLMMILCPYREIVAFMSFDFGSEVILNTVFDPWTIIADD